MAHPSQVPGLWGGALPRALLVGLRMGAAIWKTVGKVLKKLNRTTVGSNSSTSGNTFYSREVRSQMSVPRVHCGVIPSSLNVRWRVMPKEDMSICWVREVRQRSSGIVVARPGCRKRGGVGEREQTFLVRWVSEDLTHGVVTVVDNAVSCPWKLLRRSILTILTKRKKISVWGGGCVSCLITAIISPRRHIPTHHVYTLHIYNYLWVIPL